MMSSILLNPQLIIYSTALGGIALAIRIDSCFICGIAAEIPERIFYKNKPFFDFSGFDEPKKSRDTNPNLFLRFLFNLGRNIKATGLYFLLGVKAVYAQVMSEAAVKVFAENGIDFKYDISVKIIINRSGTGICPMEETVSELFNPKEAWKAIRAKLTQLAKR